ncbi:hypothetical protein SLA_2067 [Streptomyces laurentii]|uniref:Potassium channel domain-containing protein n=1 Tax=Streptomyces laurentii TaxID=39478 RepID=A0A160NXS8_STRLU|nr:hypothetical protein SLA_2067 [Streptomyces laurentii]
MGGRVLDDVPGSKPDSRVVLLSVLGTLARIIVVLAIYFLIPMDHAMSTATAIGLTLGVLGLGVVVAWQLREISHADYPVLRAVQALAFTLPLFILLFATAYFVMEHAQAASFNQPLSRLDAMYFAVTTFTTVGYGDIVPASSPARIVAVGQMVLDLVVLGFLIRMVAHAIKSALDRRPHETPPSGPRP